MNAVRPFITITILGAVAWFLYVKINQGVLRPGPAANETSQAPAIPPLDGTAPAPPKASSADVPTSTASVAPQWPSENTNSAAPKSNSAPATSPAIPSLPDLPAIPELAPIAKTDSAAPAAANRYGSALSANDTPATSVGSSITSPTGSAALTPEPPASDVAPFPTPAVAPKPAAKSSEQDTAAENAMAAMGLTSSTDTTPSATPSGPSDAPVAAASPAVDRYGMPIAATSSANPSAPTTPPAASLTNPTAPPATTSFATAWTDIQAALDRGELAKAHQMLSPWYGDPALTPAESERVDNLLGQLAGTVIYSTEHRLAPPYTVKPGDTLESIAKQLEVPWQLLAKINGVSTPDQVKPGQQLKVIRGPFGAMVDLRRNRVALSVDGRYAGRFPMSASAAAEIPQGEWIVVEKPVTPQPSASVYGASVATSAGARSIVLKSASGNATQPAILARIAATESPITPVTSAVAEPRTPFLLKVSPHDADELADILSIGSRVVIQR